MDFGLFTINTGAFSGFWSQDITSIEIQLMAILGWVVLDWLLLYTVIHMFLEYKQKLYVSQWKWVLLAVDVPPMNVQTPKAVEQLFNHLAGAFNNPDLEERFILGFKQRWFSFEIISIEGYIQFLIRTEERFRDLVEAAVYAQYSDAEITEVEDYVDLVPSHYPNEYYDVWAADFGLAEHFGQPLRSYTEFEHKISKDTVLKDPMGTFLESFSRLGAGEQMWFQILVEPISNSWKEQVIKKMEEITEGKSSHAHGGGVAGVLDNIPTYGLKAIEFIGDQVFGRMASEYEEHEEKEEKKVLSPGQGKLLEGMETKIQKIGFKTKMRGVYAARKEMFKPEHGVNALIGAVTQFNIPNSNSIIPVYKTVAAFFFKQARRSYRKNLLIRAYKKRKMKTGGNSFVLNIEELASIWHFPMSHVKTPLVQKAVGKRGEPPAGLPTESVASLLAKELDKTGKKVQTNRVPGKNDLLTDSGHVIAQDDVKFG